MLWLASYPRSGNTFFRNILFEVYGLESTEVHYENLSEETPNGFEVVKTHLIPKEIPFFNTETPKVYLIRDARDSIVSGAWHRKNMYDPESHWYWNLIEVTLAQGTSYFWGWSRHVMAWNDQQPLVIRFEDLIQDPIGQVERLREVMDLPEPNAQKLPSFTQLKFGRPKYGKGDNLTSDEKEQEKFTQANFRKGKAGGWKEEMPTEIHDLVWALHGETMERMGYIDDRPEWYSNMKSLKILVESRECFAPSGEKKDYMFRMLSHLLTLKRRIPFFDVDLLQGEKIIPLEGFFNIPPEADWKYEGSNIEIKKDASPSPKPPFSWVNLIRNNMPKPLYELVLKNYSKLKYSGLSNRITNWRAIHRQVNADYDYVFFPTGMPMSKGLPIHYIDAKWHEDGSRSYGYNTPSGEMGMEGIKFRGYPDGIREVAPEKRGVLEAIEVFLLCLRKANEK